MCTKMVNVCQGIDTIQVVYLKGKAIFNQAMDVREIRRRNLRLIIDTTFGGKAANLARVTGKQPNEISRVFSQNPKHRREIGHAFAREIEKAAGKDEGWLDREQWAIAEPRSGYGNTEIAPTLSRRVPLVSWVQAGSWCGVEDHYPPGEGEEQVPTTAKVGPRAYALRVRGDSMEPKFPEGSIIIVDPDAAIDHRAFVIVRLDNEQEATFKQFIIDGDRRYLKPLNPRYPILDISGPATFCGRVVRVEMDV